MADSAHLGVGSESGNTSAGRLTIMLADLALSVVAGEAPEQVELLAEVTARWEAGYAPGRWCWGWMSGSVDFGIDPTVLSDLIYPLLVGTFAQVLGEVTLTGWKRRRRRSGLRSVPRAQVTLGADQIEEVLAACTAHGMTLGLSEASTCAPPPCVPTSKKLPSVECWRSADC